MSELYALRWKSPYLAPICAGGGGGRGGAGPPTHESILCENLNWQWCGDWANLLAHFHLVCGQKKRAWIAAINLDKVSGPGLLSLMDTLLNSIPTSSRAMRNNTIGKYIHTILYLVSLYYLELHNAMSIYHIPHVLPTNVQLVVWTL
jgi:hypothetical protein